MSFQKFPSIEQYRDCIKEVSSNVRYRGRDANDKPVYEKSYKLPTIDFTGTVKLHGANAAVARRGNSGSLWAQSRNRIISLDSDNHGFCTFVQENEKHFDALLSLVEGVNENDVVTIFGEWCGQGIQKNVAIAALPKMFVVFAAKIGENDQETWLSPEKVAKLVLADQKCALIHNIYSFPTFTMKIDFNQPDASQMQLEALTDAVEKQCPVGAKFGVNGIGEGIVWVGENDGRIYRFKVKGDEHAVTKKKNSAATKPEIQDSVGEFVKNVVTQQRCEQGIQEVFKSENKTAQLSETGTFIRWVLADVLKEESDTISASNLNKDQVAKSINDAARSWFKKYCCTTAPPAPCSSDN